MLNESEEFRKNPNIQIEYEEHRRRLILIRAYQTRGDKAILKRRFDDTDDLNDADNKNKESSTYR